MCSQSSGSFAGSPFAWWWLMRGMRGLHGVRRGTGSSKRHSSRPLSGRCCTPRHSRFSAPQVVGLPSCTPLCPSRSGRSHRSQGVRALFLPWPFICPSLDSSNTSETYQVVKCMKNTGGLLWWSSGQHAVLPMQGARLPSLVRGLDPTCCN